MSKPRPAKRRGAPAGRPEVVDLEKQLPVVIAALKRKDDEKAAFKGFNEFVKKLLSLIAHGVPCEGIVKRVIIEVEGVSGGDVPAKIWQPALVACAPRDPQLALMVVQLLLKRCKDVDGFVRAASLRTLASLRISTLLEELKTPILDALEDPSPVVRCAAVVAVLKVQDLDPELAEQCGMLARVAQLLRDDPSPDVRANCVFAAIRNDRPQEIVADQELVYNLRASLPMFKSTQQCIILGLLGLYQPSSEPGADGSPPEFALFMDSVDPCLSSTDSSVVLAAAKALLCWTREDAYYFSEAINRVKRPLYAIIQRDEPEIAYCALKHMLVLVARSPYTFADDYSVFFPRHADMPYIKVLKLDVLKHLAAIENQHALVEELIESTKDRNAGVARAAVQALGHVVLTLSSTTGLIEELLALLGCGDANVVSETVVMAKDIIRQYPSSAEAFGAGLIAVPITELCNPEAVSAYIWIRSVMDLQFHIEEPEGVTPTPYVLEDYIATWADLSRQVKLALIDGTVRVCLARASETLPVLKRLFEEALSAKEVDADVRDRALLARQALSTDLKTAQLIFTPDETESIRLDDVTDEASDKIFQEFNTLSVVFNKPSYLFVDPAAYRHQTKMAMQTVDEVPENEEAAMTEAPDADLLDFDGRLESDASESNVMGMDELDDLVDFSGQNAAASSAPAVAQLDPMAAMTREEFHGHWARLENAAYFSEPLYPGQLAAMEASAYAEFNQQLGQMGLKVLAQGDPAKYRAFLFGKTVDVGTPVLILYEVVKDGGQAMLTVTVRTPDPALAAHVQAVVLAFL